MLKSTPERILSTMLWVLGFGGAGVAGYFSLRAAGVVGELPRGEGGNFLVSTLTTTSTKEEFVRAVMSAAAAADASLSTETRALLAAWAAHESGWGKTKQAKLGNNIFNVSKGSWTGPTIAGGDTEYEAGSNEAKKITQQWRQYATLEAAISDLLALLKNSRYINYREAHVALLDGQQSFATRLGVFERINGTVTRVENRPDTAGFYTQPRSEYQKGINDTRVVVKGAMASMGLAGLKLNS